MNIKEMVLIISFRVIIPNTRITLVYQKSQEEKNYYQFFALIFLKADITFIFKKIFDFSNQEILNSFSTREREHNSQSIKKKAKLN